MENHTLVDHVRNEFIEMRGLQLTPAQAARLWGMDTTSCHDVIAGPRPISIPRWTAEGMVVRSEY